MTPDELVGRKGGRTVSVVIPAFHGEVAAAAVVDSVAPLVGTLVDEIVVADSGPWEDRGDVLWRALAATGGDLVVFLDGDVVDPDPADVSRLLGPLLTAPGVQLVKGYHRDPAGGGRVTELLVRPLVASLSPELASIIALIGSDLAGTRDLLRSIPFAPGHGVEIGILLDTVAELGIDGVGQADLGVRELRSRPLAELGPVARQIVATLLERLGIEDSQAPLTQFLSEDDGYRCVETFPVPARAEEYACRESRSVRT
ncbi:glucosyl-3-phosphoglycerate synthase [Gordonia rubripertincta]|uniref:Glucosyl-3-phosphoglycerate synthase n=1 Tax=Gordonia rubripertincta TaxID=36822 RepID=A0AAW4G808_GORRU|nr:glucosyl-3-phosphoglycerate synthase [Gordonia rubripertincta]MBM7279861.1 glucosyl-3-phosphoglycerate synthase [Gordonia rubripertincta]